MEPRDRWNAVVREARDRGFDSDPPGLSRLGGGPPVTLGLLQVRAGGDGSEVVDPIEGTIHARAWVELWAPPVHALHHFAFRRRWMPRLFVFGTGLGKQVARRFDIAGWPRPELSELFTPEVARALAALAPCPSWQLFQSTMPAPAGGRRGCMTANFPLVHASGEVLARTLDVLDAISLAA